MLVAVKTETLVNTPRDAALVACSVSYFLNKGQSLSGIREKTCFNFSKGCRISNKAPTYHNTHYWHACAGRAS